MSQTEEKKDKQGKGPKYFLDIEGREVPWDQDTITTEQIIALGGWEPSQGAIVIDKDNNERTLRPGEVIEIKPGQGFSKKVRFKRGLFAERIDRELLLIKSRFADVTYESRGQWIHLPRYVLPQGWNRVITPVAFQILPAYPGAPPYGFYTPVGLRFQDKVPGNYTEPAPTQPPFTDKWAVFSWTVDGNWRPTADVTSGSNLLNWVLGFMQRFQEGQ
jgi:Multiubiquitin